MFFGVLLFIRNIIEIFCLFTIGGITANKILPFQKVLFSSIILTSITMLLRMLPIKFGIHTLISITLMIFFYHNVFRLSINRSAIAAFSTIIILVTLEWGNMVFFLNKFLGLSIEEVGTLTNTKDMFLIGLFPVFILILLAITGRFFLLKKLKTMTGATEN